VKKHPTRVFFIYKKSLFKLGGGVKMRVRKGLAFILLIAALAILVIGCGGTPTEETVQLGIIQLVEHPSLDAARQGFLDILAENGYKEGENLEVDFQNAQNDQSVIQTIANKFVNEKKDLVLAIATPAAQGIAAATKEIPILITAVTDPVAAGLVESMEKPGTNVTGTTDMTPVKEQLELLLEIKPEVKNVGIIFNPSEKNSEVQVNIAKEAAEELNINLIEAPATKSSEVYQAANSLVGRVDAIYVPTDNTVVSTLESVIQVAEDNDLPLIVGEGDSVRRGGMATIGIDYYKLGQQTGEIALRILQGENPADIAIESQKEMNLIINKGAAERMNVIIPQEILDRAVEVVE